MGHIVAYTVELGPGAISTGPGWIGAIASVAFIALWFVLSVAGATLGYRTLRDGLSAERGYASPDLLSCIAATLATVLFFLSSGAAIVGLAIWLHRVSTTIRRKRLARASVGATETA